MCPGVTIIPKDVSQHGFDFTNKRCGNYPLCNFLETHFFAVVDAFCRDIIFNSTKVGVLSLLKGK